MIDDAAWSDSSRPRLFPRSYHKWTGDGEPADMRIAYFDCFSGASGDMILGALLDAGCPADRLEAGLAALKLADARLTHERIKKQGFAATKVHVQLSQPGGHRHLKHITAIIDAAGLSPRVAADAHRIFRRLAEAEARAHNSTVEKVHFHEVGAADAIIDIVGAALALELLDIDRVECSPIPTGSGTVRCEHGLMPVPAPGTAALLEGVPLAANDEPGELTTPTGAAILTTLAQRYGALPAMTLERTGYGAGSRDGVTRPNLLRVLIGSTAAAATPDEADEITVLEANLDDATGEQIGYAVERLFAAGALDAFTVPVQMKKGRPGVLLSVLCTAATATACEDVLLGETSTFGVRRSTCTRRKLARTVERVQTSYGEAGVKIGRSGGRAVQVAPEYEDCARLAREKQVALREVMDAVRRAWIDHPQ